MFIYSIICSHVSNIVMQVQHSGLIFIYLFLGLEFCFHFKLFNIWLYRQLDTMGPNKWKIWIMPMISRSLRAFNLCQTIQLTQLLTRPLNILITPQDLSITLATREIMSFRFLILIQPLLLLLIAHIRIMVHQMVMLLNGQVTSQITFIMAMILNWVQYNIMVPTTRFLRISWTCNYHIYRNLNILNQNKSKHEFRILDITFSENWTMSILNLINPKSCKHNLKTRLNATLNLIQHQNIDKSHQDPVIWSADWSSIVPLWLLEQMKKNYTDQYE